MGDILDYTVKRSSRCTIGLEITRDCKVIVRAPYGVSNSEIEKFVSGLKNWINKKLLLQKKRQEKNLNADMHKDELLKQARLCLPPLVERYSALMGLRPASVKITSAKTRFGSCSGKNAICFSWRLMAYPQAAVEYVVVHELAHIAHHNHSKEFYNTVKKYMPDYKERQKLLKTI